MATRQPTNSDILKELRDMSGRISSLETWRTAQDAYKEALAQVKRDEKLAKDESRKSDIYKQVMIILGLLVAILTTAASTRGILR